MPTKNTLTTKQKCFVDEYLVDLNATQAAIRAGYSQKNASQIAYELLEKTLVKEAVANAMAQREQRIEITQDQVMVDLEAIKHNAMMLIPDKDGNLLMANHHAALKAADLQGRHLGMFRDNLSITGSIGVTPKKVEELTDEELYAIIAAGNNQAGK